MSAKSGKLVCVLLLAAAAGLYGAPPAPAPGLAPRPGEKNGAPPPRKNFRRRPPKMFFSKLTQEERDKIDRLAKEGKKDELWAFMRQLFHKYRPEEMKQLDALGEQFRKTSDEQEKARIRGKMRELAKTLFLKRQEFTRNSIADAEKELVQAQQELRRLKQRYEHNEQNADKIINGHVEQMCLPPEQRKRFGPGGKFRPGPGKNPPPHPAKP